MEVSVTTYEVGRREKKAMDHETDSGLGLKIASTGGVYRIYVEPLTPPRL